MSGGFGISGISIDFGVFMYFRHFWGVEPGTPLNSPMVAITRQRAKDTLLRR